MDVLNEQFGTRLRHLRTLNGLTQKELASKTNISSQIISNLERGYTKAISYQDLKKLTEHLDCSIGDLIPDADKHSLPDAAEIDIIDYLSTMIEMVDTYTNLKIDGIPIDESTREVIKIMLTSIIDVAGIRTNKSSKQNNLSRIK